MLQWLGGGTRQVTGNVDSIGEDQSEFPDAPETPAPVFAIRAFKTALFGTPAPVALTRRTQERSPGRKAIVLDAVVNSQEEEDMEVKRVSGLRLSSGTVDRMSNNASPSKGILLTPGTGTSRPKRVSFDGLGAVKDNRLGQIARRTKLQEITLEDLPDIPQTTEAQKSEQVQVRGSSTRNLPKSNEGTTEATSKPKIRVQSILLDNVKIVETKNPKPSEQGSDATIDLKDPVSQSGKHWKCEYSKYHEKSEDEMTRLIRKNKATRDYAMEKDREALNLKSKLEEALSQVSEMEAKVSELAARVFKGEESGDGRTQEDLIAELASQTAKAVRYKRKAEKYDLAIQEKRVTNAPDRSGDRDTESNALSELTAAEDQTTQLSALRSEVSRLNRVVESAEARAAKLESQNRIFSNNINRVREEMKKHEARNIIRRQNTEKLKEEKQQLKAESEQAREENQKQKNENENLYGVIAAIGPVTEEEIVRSLVRQVLQLKDELKGLKLSSTKNQPTLPQQFEGHEKSQPNFKLSKVESIDVWNDIIATSNPSDNATAKPASTSRRAAITIEGGEDFQQPGLSLRNQNSSKNNQADSIPRSMENKQVTEQRNAYEKIPKTYEKTGLRRKAPTSSIRQNNFEINPVGSISPDLSKSSPKAASKRATHPRRMSEMPEVTQPIFRSSRPGSMTSNRSRISLPPDRIAAAKLRLAEKNRERAMGKDGNGKENVRP
ncbi:MAG: hypothetical protein MMC33_001277 [Icmadophila ericetorum]|nr:hypothetical protein [Icmadophila ericetorum]